MVKYLVTIYDPLTEKNIFFRTEEYIIKDQRIIFFDLRDKLRKDFPSGMANVEQIFEHNEGDSRAA